MRAWWKRLLGGPVAPAAGPIAAPLQAPTSARDPALADAAPGAPASPVDVVAPGFGARRPLLSTGGEIAGFEFELATSARDRTRGLIDPTAQAAQAARAIALLSSMRSTVDGGRTAFATLSLAVLARPAVEAQATAGMMLALDGDDAMTPTTTEAAVVAALRGRGVRIGLPAALATAGAAFDFIALPASPRGLDGQLEAALRCRAVHPGITLVATGLRSIDELERALQAGVTFVSGWFDAPRVVRDKRPAHAGVQRICQMLNRVVADQDTALIARDIGVDVTLSYRMLRYVNSPALGLTRKVDSIEQAVMLLGRDELYRWLSVLLLAGVDGRKASRALQEVSLARARLLEGLARERGIDPPAALFTVGLLSLLDGLLQVPLDVALQPLHLGDAARQALLEQRGEWYEYLALAIDLERHDLEAAAVRAERFGGLDAVLPHAEQAWRWAGQVQAAMRG